MDNDPVVNPWLGEQIIRLRSVSADGELRDMYRAEQETAPGKTWEAFLCETALRAAVKAAPRLLERREEMDLPESVRERLYMNRVMVLADLAQLTREVLEGIPGFTREELDTLYAFLEGKGLPARSCSREVYMVFYPDTAEAYDRLVAEVRGLVQKAGGSFDDLDEQTFDEAVERADGYYEEALRKVGEYSLSPLEEEYVVSRYTDFMDGYRRPGKEYMQKIERYALRDLALCQKVYGPTHRLTGKAHRRLGEFYCREDRFREMPRHYLEAARITRETEGGPDARSGQDLMWAGYALSQLGRYKEAVDLYLISYRLALQYPGNPYIHPEPISDEISGFYAQMGDAQKAREWKEIAESYRENED